MKKIILTGSSGFVGKNLLNKLKCLGNHVIEFDIVNGINITDWDQIKNSASADLIIHLAAKTNVPESYNKPREFYDVNITGTLNMLELARLIKAKFIFASSYIYGDPDYLPIDEKHPVKPFNPYANSKILAEQLCEGYNKYFDVPVIILRPFNLYGNGLSNNFLMPSIISQLKNGIILLDDPDPKRDFLFIDDMVDAYIKCIESDIKSFKIFNIGSGYSYSVKEIAEKIVSLSGLKINIKYSGKKRKNEVMNVVANISKAYKGLKWEPFTGIDDGINKMLENIKL